MSPVASSRGGIFLPQRNHSRLLDALHTTSAMSADGSGFHAILNELNRDAACARPGDPLQFCASWFQKKLERDRSASRTAEAASMASMTPTPAALASQDLAPDALAGGEAIPFDFSGFGFVSTSSTCDAARFAPPPGSSCNSNASATSAEEEAERPNPIQVAAAPVAPGRRTSVSAESIHPGAMSTQKARGARAAAALPKTEAQQRRIREAVGNHFLFRHLEEEQYNEAVSAMKEQHVPAGVAVIQQGDEDGDYFYAVESGTLDVYKRSELGGDPNDPGDRVCSYGPGATFGELALMYAQPRAATVLATSRCTLWAVDRVTFRTILLDTSSRKRLLFHSLLRKVPLFEHMHDEERAKIADALEVRTYSVGDRPVQQGDHGKEFFIIIEGHADVKKRSCDAGPSTSGARYTGEGETVVGRLGPGDYFGELALLHNAPRVASIVAAEHAGSTDETAGSGMEVDEPQTEDERVEVRPAKKAKRSSGKLKVALMSEHAFTRLLGPLAGIMSRHAREQYGDAGAAEWEQPPEEDAGPQGVELGRPPVGVAAPRGGADNQRVGGR